MRLAPDELGPGEAVRSRALLLIVAIGGTVAEHAWRLWYAHHRWIDLDEMEHLHAAWSVARGMLPYRDFFEHHPPLLYFAIAPFFHLADVDTSADAATAFVFGARFAMWGLAAVALALTYAIGARWRSREVGLVAMVLLSGSLVFSEKVIEVRPDVPALALWLAALWLLLPRLGGEHASGFRAALAGVALGLGLSFTQKLAIPIAGLLVAMVWGLVRETSSAGRNARARDVVVVMAGAALVVLCLAAAFALLDGLGQFIFFTTSYNARLGRLVSPLVYGKELLLANPLLTTGGLAAMACSLWKAPRSSGTTFESVLAVSGAALVVGALVGPSTYQQYFLPLLPIFALLAGALLVRLVERFVARSAHRALAALVVAGACWPVLQMAQRSRPEWGNADGLADLRWVIEHTSPRDSVLAGWRTIPGAFRPHAFFYFFLSSRQALAAVPDDDRAALRTSIATGERLPALVVADEYARALVPELDRVLAARYVPTERRGIFRLAQSARAPSDSLWSAADSSAAIAGARIVLRATAWRDFMPSVAREPGSDLMINLILSETRGAALPAALRVDSAWVRSSRGTWAAAPSREPRPTSGTALDLMLRGGPAWPVGTSLDVLVRAIDAGGGAHYLRDRRAAIGRVD